jgi:hypothetical protein
MKPVIDKIFSFDQAKQAFADMEKRRAFRQSGDFDRLNHGI